LKPAFTPGISQYVTSTTDPPVRRILVAVDGDEDLGVVDHAIELARVHRARLELVGGIPRLWFSSAYALDCARLEAELKVYAAELLRAAVDRVDDDIPVTLRQVNGRAADHLLRRHEDAPGDLLVVRGSRRPAGLRGRRRHREAALVRVPVKTPTLRPA